MPRRLAYVLVAVGLIITPYSAIAHGTGYRQSSIRSVSLEFCYSTGETMSYLDAKVFSPRDDKFAFQSGRTDEDGRFAFTPNTDGLWRVVVRDEEGHLAEAKVDVAPELPDAKHSGGNAAVIPKAAVPSGMELVVKAGLGVSLIFNAAAFWSLARRRGAASEVK
jgi:nickel transport protein